MEPENIGIQSLLETVQNEPEKYTRLIALMAIRLLWQETIQNGKEKPVSIRDTLITASHKPNEIQIQRTREIVERVLQEHFKNWRTNNLVDQESYWVISRACMHLLGLWLKKRWQWKLAHDIHDAPYSNSLLQAERLALLDRGIIAENQIFHVLSNEHTQIWSGHETQRKYVWKSRPRNILAQVTKREWGIQKADIFPLLRAESIHIAKNHILGFSGRKIEIFDKPSSDDNDNYNITTLFLLDCSIGNIENIEGPLSVRTWWDLYRITGKQTKEDGTKESTTITQKITLCVNLEKPGFSYVTPSKRFLVNGNVFTLDTAKNMICVLAHWKIIEIPYTSIWEIIKEGDGNEYFPFTQNGIDKKLTFSSGEPEIISLS